MKILMFGRGVISAVYGWALEKAGHSVDFYVRPGRAAQYGSVLNLRLLDARKKLRGVWVEEAWPVRMREDLPADHDYDVIIVSVQHYRFAEVAAFLASRVSRATVLIFNNFFTEPRAEVAALPAGQVAWGFPRAGGGFDASGTLIASVFGGVDFGGFGAALTERELAVRNLFREAGFGITEQADFRGWLWVHFATNAGLQAQALKVGSFSGLVSSIRDLRSAILNVREMFRLVEARGVDLSKHTTSTIPFRLPSLLGALMLKGANTLVPPVRVVLESHTNPEELRFTCRDALAEARRMGFAATRLEALQAGFA